MISEAELYELRALCPDARPHVEGGIEYVFLPHLLLPDGCSPQAVDCLLCLGARDGYDNRLFFSAIVACAAQRNWNGVNIRVLERNWFAYSWRVPSGLRPIETLISHLKALRI
jgi:hypothetical protein